MQSMLQFFEEVPDFRVKSGRRYSIGQLLSMITLSYMCNNYSMQSTRRFIVNNKEDLLEMFDLEHGVPSYDLIRTFLLQVDFADVNEAFSRWVNSCVEKSDEKVWLSLDGKCLGSTVSDCQNTRQDFQSMVAAFMTDSEIAIQYEKYDNGKESEAGAVRTLVDRLEEEKYIITLDALHCQKKL